MTIETNPFINMLIFSFLSIFSSCIGQNTPTGINQNKIVATGQSVSEMDRKITVIFEDSRHNYWFGGGEKGVYKYDGKSMVLFTMKEGLCSPSILGIQEDKLGNLYFDTTEGICKFDGQQFTTLPVVNASEHDWKLTPDDLWFRMGWDKNGPYRYDGKNLYHLPFPKNPMEGEFYAKYPNAPFEPYGIYSLYTDQQGNIWFGTSSLGIYRFDGKKVSWMYEQHLTETPEGGAFGIRSIIEDRNGNFWFCNTRYRYEILQDTTKKNGLNLMNYKKARGMADTTDDDAIDFPYFMSIVEDNRSNLWMATYDDGVWRYDGKQLLHYPINDGETAVLLFSIYKDRQGMLWLGTHNAGAYQFNGETFEQFSPDL